MSQKTYRPMTALLLAGALSVAAASADPASAEPYSSKVVLTCDATPLCHASGPKVAIGQQLTIQFVSCFVEILYAGPEVGLAFLGVDNVYGTGAKFRGMSRLMLKSAKRAAPVAKLCSFRGLDKMLFR